MFIIVLFCRVHQGSGEVGTTQKGSKKSSEKLPVSGEVSLEKTMFSVKRPSVSSKFPVNKLTEYFPYLTIYFFKWWKNLMAVLHFQGLQFTHTWCRCTEYITEATKSIHNKSILKIISDMDIELNASWWLGADSAGSVMDRTVWSTSGNKYRTALNICTLW